jgi:hypothetical protein
MSNLNLNSLPFKKMGDRPLLESILPLLTGRYERLRENMGIVLANVYVSDFEGQYKSVFPNLLLDSVEPKNKLLTRSFIQNNLLQIQTAIGE